MVQPETKETTPSKRLHNVSLFIVLAGAAFSILSFFLTWIAINRSDGHYPTLITGYELGVFVWFVPLLSLAIIVVALQSRNNAKRSSIFLTLFAALGLFLIYVRYCVMLPPCDEFKGWFVQFGLVGSYLGLVLVMAGSLFLSISTQKQLCAPSPKAFIVPAGGALSLLAIYSNWFSVVYQSHPFTYYGYEFSGIVPVSLLALVIIVVGLLFRKKPTQVRVFLITCAVLGLSFILVRIYTFFHCAEASFNASPRLGIVVACLGFVLAIVGTAVLKPVPDSGQT